MTDELVQQLLDIEAIKKVQARYFRYVDTKQWDAIPTVFTDDAYLELDGSKFENVPGFAQMLETVIGQAPTVHHGHMPEIELTGPDTAEAIWAMEDLLSFPAAEDAPPGHRGYGHYTETLRRTGGGWLIERMVLTRTRMDSLANWTQPPDHQPVKRPLTKEQRMEAIYTATAISTGDGRNGHVATKDGLLDTDVRLPKEMGGPGGATNPEELFAAGYAACFHSALKNVGRETKADLTGTEVTASVAIGKLATGGFGLAVELDIHAPGLDYDTALKLTEKAHQVCPYSNATRGNVDVVLKIV